MTSRSVVSPFLTLALFCCVTAASADVLIESHYPVKGVPVDVRVTDDNGNPVSGATIEVTYRPGSSVERTEPIGSSSGGLVQWTPSEAGIATVTASWTVAGENTATSSTNVSVKFSSPPLDGILIMVVAGLLLVVGSVIRVANLLRVPEASP